MDKNRIRSKLKIRGKIILALLGIILGLLIVLYGGFAIAVAMDFDLPDVDELVGWAAMIFFVSLAALAIGIFALFAVVINYVIVERVRRLNAVTWQVARGNFSRTLDVKGYDELSELTSSFNKMMEELRANEYLNRDFVRNISHEYKTPLSVVKAYSELIALETRQENVDKKVLEEYTDIIISEVDRLSNLSKDILQISLLDSTTIIKQTDEFCPAEQIRNILKAMQVKWMEKNIEFELDLSGSDVKSNEQLLYHVWQNLISNAIKFSPNGGKIILRLAREDNKLFFEITDFGKGISEKNLDKIFGQFFVVNKSRKGEGSGLGLAIVKKIAKKLGGDVSVESQVGVGSTFRVEVKVG